MPLLFSVKDLQLPGVKIADLARLPDERGVFTEVIRMDWMDLLGGESIVQANLSVTYPGIVRAWHRHIRGQTDYFLVLRGSIKVCAYDDDEASPTKGGLVEVVLSDDRMQILRVPGKYWHGFKVVSPKPAYLLYFVNRLYDYSDPDEERRPWNDASIIPRFINGRTDDPRCNKPWDWFYPPHK
ncbi:MAG: dTDP-4-dehydrorhamnose 3,5-epimerase family protein [Candidatus Bathyarchaeia archaeon]|nr:dTDP-4-dehydrorhamnose 3,5-epimerase family protein [Candidatus Bathyarchaeota archaeon]